MRSIVAAAAVVWCSVFVWTAPADLHSFLDRAEPKVGSTLGVPPAEVRLWFSQTLESALSRVEVVDGAGRRVDERDGRVDSADRTLLRISLPALAPGLYRVIWRAVSPDGQATEGDYMFRISK
jgi:copper resistance protein C